MSATTMPPPSTVPAKDNKAASYLLQLTPINLSLTAGTGIPAPPASPSSPLSRSVSPLVRPPTPGGGPLSSHPATPIEYIAGSWFPSPPSSRQTSQHSHHHRTSKAAPPTTETSPSPSSRVDSAISVPHPAIERKPLAPMSSNAPPQQPQPQRRNSSSVRKLLSLSGLRHSFVSLNYSRSVSSPLSQPQPQRPIISEPVPHSEFHNSITGVKRPSASAASIHSASTDATSFDDGKNLPGKRLRKRKSVGWFQRKSSLFATEQDDGDVEMATQRKHAAARRASALLSVPVLGTGVLSSHESTGQAQAQTERRDEAHDHDRDHDNDIRMEVDVVTQEQGRRPSTPPPMLPHMKLSPGGVFGDEEMFAGITGR